MTEKKSIRDVFGIDFLLDKKQAAEPRPASESSAKQAAAPAADESTGLFEKAKQLRQWTQVLGQLRSAPNLSRRLYELVDPTGLPLPLLLTVTDILEKNALLTVMERDKLGNYLVQMTPRGQEFLETLTS